MRYAGRTVVITGAAGGLGSGMAAAFAAEGADVALVDLPDSPGKRWRAPSTPPRPSETDRVGPSLPRVTWPIWRLPSS